MLRFLFAFNSYHLFWRFIPKQLEESVFDCVDFASKFRSSLAPCSRAMVTRSRSKNFEAPPRQIPDSSNCFGISVKVNTARLLLSKLREGDYAHAGDKEAIDLVIQKVLQLAPDLKKGNCIDIGCGFGGTANDFYQSGFTRIWGIDNDQSAISYAQAHYPHLTFICADAQKISDYFEPDFFSLIYLFNVIYAIEDKHSLLKKLSTVAKPGAILVLFDYTSEGNQLAIKDFAGKSMFPMNLQNLTKDLETRGWKIIEISDLTSQFINWYKSFLVKLANNRETLASEFSEADISRVQNTFTFLLDYLEKGKLGGTLLLAIKKHDS